MAEITSNTSLQELAATISQHLEAQGVVATLSGGAAVSIYTNNRYQSYDLDFVSSAGSVQLSKAVAHWALLKHRQNGCLPTQVRRGCWSFQLVLWGLAKRLSMRLSLKASALLLGPCE